EYPREHLLAIADRLRRKPLLWDNYPVNDAKRLTNFLHLKPASRDPELKELTAGLMANPMNEAYLSQLPLYALASQLEMNAASFATACAALCPPALAEALQRDVDLFQQMGLDSIATTHKDQLVREYARFQRPMADEVCAWLRG